MNEEKTREILEGLEIPEDKINELLAVMKDQEEHPLKDGDKVGDYTFHTLKEQMDNETDWRKKASLAAKIISINLE